MQPLPVARRQRLADLAVRVDAAGDFVGQLDHHPQQVVPARPCQRVFWPLERVDQRVEQPRVHQRAEHVARIAIFPRPRHGRLVADAARRPLAVDHHRGIHGHPLPRTAQPRCLQDARRADTACRQDHFVRPQHKRFAGPLAGDTDRVAVLDQHPLDARLCPQIDAGRDCVVHVLGGAPLRAAAAAQHTGCAAVKMVGARRLHELVLRTPVVAQRLAGLSDAGRCCAAQLSRQRRDVQIQPRIGHVSLNVHAVARLQPGRRRRGAATVHAGRPAHHQRTDDVQSFLGKEQAAPVRVDERAEIGAVVRLAAVVDAPFQQHDPLSARARQLPRQCRTARPRTNDHHIRIACRHVSLPFRVSHRTRFML